MVRAHSHLTFRYRYQDGTGTVAWRLIVGDSRSGRRLILVGHALQQILRRLRNLRVGSHWLVWIGRHWLDVVSDRHLAQQRLALLQHLRYFATLPVGIDLSDSL